MLWSSPASRCTASSCSSPSWTMAGWAAPPRPATSASPPSPSTCVDSKRTLASDWSSVTVGASTTPGTYLLPAALGRFHATYPGITLRLEISDTREIERAVAVSQLELGVIGEAPLVPGLAAEPWVKDG